MKCANCGGTIHLNESCINCGIGYEEMINGISHPEMKRLFKRIKKQQENHADTMMEESLMACELLNSSLILPIRKNEDIREVLQIPGPGGKIYLGVFTDAEEFRKGNVEMTLFTNSWEMLFKLIGCGVDGLVINVFDEAVFIGEDFLTSTLGMMVLRIENITHNHMMKMIGDGDLSEAFMAEITYSTFIIPLLKDFLKDMKETLSLIRAVKSISWISMILLTSPKSLSLTTHPRIQDMIQGNCEIIEIWKE